jgi:hypothetical protein
MALARARKHRAASEAASLFGAGHLGRKRRVTRPEGADASEHVETGHAPRLSRLMALAIRFDRLVRDGAVRGYADLARPGHVTRARVTQIMNLLNLAPDMQDGILFLPGVEGERETVSERQVRAAAREVGWGEQRKMGAEAGEPAPIWFMPDPSFVIAF